MATPAPHLVDDILEEIFLRLPTPAALARVSTSCPRFHRIITERPFLRRYRKRHPPPLLGLVSVEEVFFPVQAPHPSAPLARALDDAADFTYSFLPECSVDHWEPRDARDGRVLVQDTRGDVPGAYFTKLPLAVCDPVSRRYVLLPVIPEEMTAQQDHLVEFGPKLAPIGEDDEDETSFKVVCPALYETKLVVFVFSSVTGQWCIAASTSWSSLGIRSSLAECYPCPKSNYVRGCLSWAYLGMDKLLVLDTGIMEFSAVDLLTGYHVQLTNQHPMGLCVSTIVDGTKGALEMLTLADDCNQVSTHCGIYVSSSFYIYHTTQQKNGESSDEWQLKNVMELPPQCLYTTMGATEGFLFLLSLPTATLDDNGNELLPEDNLIRFYSLEVKTFELKEVSVLTYHPSLVHLYFGFPPSLSKPSL